MSESRFCPKCGAYWSCSCASDELNFLPDERCEHDWAEVVGVELDQEVAPGSGRVFGCRLCGLLVAASSGDGPW